MTGPEHYTEAERLIENPRAAVDIARAQVHATLALAAATALGSAPAFSSYAHSQAWTDVAG